MIHDYLIVFQDSTDKTNIQQGELISLLELQKNDIILNIIEDEEIIKYVNLTKPDFLTFNNTFKEDYTGLNVAFLLFLSQSAIVLTNFELDTNSLAQRAGYIQSIGKLVFFTRWENLETTIVSNLILDFFIKQNKQYEHYFYTQSDNKGYQSRLESLLIDDSRQHIGKSPFNKAKTEISAKIVNDVPEGLQSAKGTESIFIFIDRMKVKETSFLKNFYVDRNIVEFGICYLSNLKQDNSIHYLDDLREMKPYWAGIYTTPHKLIRAMINLAQVDHDSLIIDPFSHTGTLSIEASHIGCRIHACDLNEIQGSKDNYDFFCHDYENFRSLVRKLESLLDDEPINELFQRLIAESVVLNTQGLPEVNPLNTIDKLIERFKDEKINLNSIENRLYFYILRRYEMENKRGADLKVQSAKELIQKYLEQYNFYGNQLHAFETVYKKTGEPIIYLGQKDHRPYLDCFEDKIYLTNRVGYISKSHHLEHNANFDQQDILLDHYNIPDDSADAVITDPPYGYGEELLKQDIIDIYSAMLSKAFRWVKNHGSIVFCALDKVKTGRKQGLLFTEDILEIVQIEAKKHGIKFVITEPVNKNGFPQGLYYWKSKYALNRSIISLKIIKKEKIL